MPCTGVYYNTLPAENTARILECDGTPKLIEPSKPSGCAVIQTVKDKDGKTIHFLYLNGDCVTYVEDSR